MTVEVSNKLLVLRQARKEQAGVVFGIRRQTRRPRLVQRGSPARAKQLPAIPLSRGGRCPFHMGLVCANTERICI